MRKRITLGFAVCLTILSSAFAQESEKRVALVIGNADYESVPLLNPVNDARDMTSALQELGFTVTTLINSTANEMTEAIQKLGIELTKGGVGLFYYAGHGMQVDGRNYLIPVDADIRAEDEMRYFAVDADLVLSKMENAGNRINIVILDACRDNPFRRSFRTSSRGLAFVDAPRDSLVIYATSPGDVAADGYGRNGVFTEALLRHIGTPEADVEIMLRNVRRDVVTQTSGMQMPWVGSSLREAFYFAETTGLGELFIVTDPVGAMISINGEEKGESPYLLKGAPLGRPLEIEARRGNMYKAERITLDQEGLHDITLVLEIERENLVISNTEKDVGMAYQRVSRQVLTSGASETAFDVSEFAQQLKLILKRNDFPYLDLSMIYDNIRLGISRTMPLLGHLTNSGSQEGGSFIFFLNDGHRSKEMAVKSLIGENVVVGKQYAVFIAVDRYNHWLPLRNPVSDAMEIRDIITRRYYIDEVFELYDEQATRAGISRLFRELIEVTKAEDSVFIFYAGHGYLDELTYNGFWIPVDGRADIFTQENWLSNNVIRGYISNMNARHVALFVDSAFSGDILNLTR